MSNDRLLLWITRILIFIPCLDMWSRLCYVAFHIKNYLFIIYLSRTSKHFWLFHANILQLSYTFGNFYTIFGSNILIQCPVPVPFLHAFCFAENPYQTESKRDKNWRIFFWNICDFWGEESTRDDARGGHVAGGAPDPRSHPVRRLAPFFHRKKANIRIKIVSKFQPNRSYGSPGI